MATTNTTPKPNTTKTTSSTTGTSNKTTNSEVKHAVKAPPKITSHSSSTSNNSNTITSNTSNSSSVRDKKDDRDKKDTKTSTKDSKPIREKEEVDSREKAIKKPPPPSRKEEDSDEEGLNEEARNRTIREAVNKYSGGMLSKKQKEEAAEKAEAILGPQDPNAACAGHLHQILKLANRYASKFSNSPGPIREYLKLLMALMRKPMSERGKIAKGHVTMLTKIYEAYRDKLKEEDLTWLDAGTDESPTGNDVVVLKYGPLDKNGNAKSQISLSDLYHYLNDSDNESILLDALQLDYDLWSIFAKITTDKEERKLYERLASERKKSLTPEMALTGISSGIKDKITADKDAIDPETGEVKDVGKIIGNVFKQLEESEDMKGVLQGFAQSAKDGTFDLNGLVRAAREGVVGDNKKEEEEDIDEEDKDE